MSREQKRSAMLQVRQELIAELETLYSRVFDGIGLLGQVGDLGQERAEGIDLGESEIVVHERFL